MEYEVNYELEFEPEFFLITFSSASHCIETEKKAKDRCHVNVIPTPREISASCGMALRFGDSGIADVADFFRELDVPSQFFALSGRGATGKRLTQKLGENG